MLLFVLVILFLNVAVIPFRVAAQQTTRVYIDPPSIVDQGMVPDTTFDIAVKIENAPEDPGVAGVEFKIFWDPSVLEGVSMVLPSGHFMEPDGDTGNFWKLKHVVEVDYVHYAYTYMDYEKGVQLGYLPKSGNGTLALITLKVVGVGSCILDLNSKIGGPPIPPPPPSIPHEDVDGYFKNSPPAPPAKIYVDPPKIADPTLTPSQTFKINISIDGATDIYNFEFKLGFDPSVLNATSAELGAFFPQSAIMLKEINNTGGYIWFSASLQPPEPAISGNGTLAVITFHVEDLGASALSLYETSLTDQTGEPLTHTTTDGRFSNILLAELYVDPPEIIDPTLLPSSTFEVNVTIYNTEELLICEFNLTYDTDVISWVGVTVHEVLNQTPSAAVFGSDVAGFLWIQLTHSAPITTYTPAALVTILFHVDAMGSTILDLGDTRLINSTSQLMPHEVRDGFFQSVTRDVAVVNVFPFPNDLYKGKTVNINITVRNEGDITETFDVSAYYDDSLIETIEVTSLPSKENVTITLSWDTSGIASCQNYKIRVEAAQIPYETDLTDNNFIDGNVKVRLWGDINGDGVVDIFDALDGSLAFGSYPEHPRWNPWADILSNDEVDIFDMLILAGNFGGTC